MIGLKRRSILEMRLLQPLRFSMFHRGGAPLWRRRAAQAVFFNGLRSALSRVACVSLVAAHFLVAAAAAETAEPAATDGGAASPLAQPLTAGDVGAFLDGMFPAAMAEQGIVGATVAVVAGGRVLVERNYGYADRLQQTRVNADTLFRIGSVTKLFTWAAVMQLVENGEIDLDADVNTYLDFKIPDKFDRPVTMRDLMTHRGGFEDQLRDLLVYDPADLTSLRNYVQQRMPARIFPPGEIPAYSNYGVTLAGYIVERVSGMPYSDYIRANILNPLGMNHTSLGQPPEDGLTLSHGYQDNMSDPVGFEYTSGTPPGIISSTAADMAQFMIAFLNDGALPGNAASRILQPETVELMEDVRTRPAPNLNGMGLGFYEESLNGVKVIGHGGDTVVFHSDLHILPTKNVGVFMSVNTRGATGGAYGIRTELHRQFMDRYFPEIARPKIEFASADAIDRDIVGAYVTGRRSESTLFAILQLLLQTDVTIDADGILSSPNFVDSSNAPMQFRQAANGEWHDVNGEDFLAVIRDGKGRIKYITLNSRSSVDVMQPVPWIKRKSWILPGLGLASVILFGSLLSWPLLAGFRAGLGQKFTPRPRELAISVWGTRAAAVAPLGFLVCVVIIIGALANNDFSVLSSNAIGFLRFVQVLATLTIASALFTAWRAIHDWLAPQERLWRTIGRTTIALSTGMIAYVAIVFGMLSPSMNF